MKKISILMAVVILLSALLAVPANAINYPQDDYYLKETIDGFTFYYRVIDNKHAELVDVIGKEVNFIPEKLGGYPVTIIGSYAFPSTGDLIEFDAEDTVDLIIPDTVTCIREYAFRGDTYLGTVKIPSSVTYIGEGAFAKCVSLRKINIPESVNRIEPNTFISCAKLKKITLHDDIEEIGDAAFLGCKSLTKFTVPAELDKIGDRAFYHCKSLKSIDFSDTAVRILGYQSLGYYNTRGGWDDGYYGPSETIRDETTKKYENFKIICNRTYSCFNIHEYAQENGFEYLANSSSENSNLGYYYAGDTLTLYIDREKLTDYKTSNSKIIKLTKTGKLTVLQKGEATVKVTLPSGKVYKGTFTVQDNPVIKQKVTVNNKNKTKYKKVKTVSVKQGKTVRVKLFGKAKSIDNKYYSTSKAQIVSKKSANTIKIKGKAKGTSTVKIKVNGVKTLSLKVNVK